MSPYFDDSINDKVFINLSILHRKRFNTKNKKFRDFFDILEVRILNIIENEKIDRKILSPFITDKMYKDIITNQDNNFKLLKMLCDWWMIVRYDGYISTNQIGFYEHVYNKEIDKSDQRLLVRFEINNKFITSYINLSLLIHIFLSTYTKPISSTNYSKREMYDPNKFKHHLHTIIKERRYLNEDDPNIELYQALIDDKKVSYSERDADKRIS